MPINKYVCSEFKEDIQSNKLIARLINSHHNTEEKETFYRLLNLIDAATFNIAAIEGIVKGTSMDPYNGWYPITPLDTEWGLLEHRAYILLPYYEEIKPVTPLISVEFHVRIYLGEDNVYFKLTDVNRIYFLRYSKGASDDINLDLNNPNSNRESISKFLRLPLPIEPEDVNYHLILDLRNRIRGFIEKAELSKHWFKEDFFFSSLFPEKDINFFGEFYKSDKIEFINI